MVQGVSLLDYEQVRITYKKIFERLDTELDETSKPARGLYVTLGGEYVYQQIWPHNRLTSELFGSMKSFWKGGLRSIELNRACDKSLIKFYKSSLRAKKSPFNKPDITRAITQMESEELLPIETIRAISVKLEDIAGSMELFYESLQSSGRTLVHSTIDELARFLGFDNRDPNHKEDMPGVVIVPQRFYEAQLDYCDMDAPHRYLPRTFFSPLGMSNGEESRDLSSFRHPHGPVIQIYLDDLCEDAVVEESLHFLQWFYETNPLLRTLRTKRFHQRMEDEYEGHGNLSVVQKDGLLVARIVPFDDREQFFQGLLHEATAAAHKSVLGLAPNSTWYERCESLDSQHQENPFLGVPRERRPSELANLLIYEGTGRFLRELLDLSKVDNIERLMLRYSMMEPQGSPRAIIKPGTRMMTRHALSHAFGSTLGYQAGISLATQQARDEFNKIVFSSEGDLEDKFEGIRRYALSSLGKS